MSLLPDVSRKVHACMHVFGSDGDTVIGLCHIGHQHRCRSTHAPFVHDVNARPSTAHWAQGRKYAQPVLHHYLTCLIGTPASATHTHSISCAARWVATGYWFAGKHTKRLFPAPGAEGRSALGSGTLQRRCCLQVLLLVLRCSALGR